MIELVLVVTVTVVNLGLLEPMGRALVPAPLESDNPVVRIMFPIQFQVQVFQIVRFLC